MNEFKDRARSFIPHQFGCHDPGSLRGVRYVSSRQNVGLSDGYFLRTKYVDTVAHCEWSGFASQMLHKAIPSHHRRARYSHGR